MSATEKIEHEKSVVEQKLTPPGWFFNNKNIFSILCTACIIIYILYVVLISCFIKRY